MSKPLDTNSLFVGGAGIFVQYFDVVKPVYLYLILKCIMDKDANGLPIEILSDLKIMEIIEWYKKRRYINPFSCLDYQHIIDHSELNKYFQSKLMEDYSIYQLAPSLNIRRQLNMYKSQYMNFPLIVYSEYENDFIKADLKATFSDIDKVIYTYGDIGEALRNCAPNFTYIFSDIELLKESSKFLADTYANVLLSKEYRYNYLDNCTTPKYRLEDIEHEYPLIRAGTTVSIDNTYLLDRMQHQFDI